ncbi:peptidyl-tRNA hydrolase Pth2 [Phytohabitans rumicis]|uniref:peptidyl-tRNA hydrolase n=1 Tax=Phytohabitans rumicis TaxID=1076125 RepID=A0A6V8L3Q9_9ACTN|nr:peptidyl-tRNA hydrolase Pth2 [Phytohabitans rumicis]GFJ91892.1 peptidyl-tRNA hydrolase [Phytohabitans rumicis]
MFAFKQVIVVRRDLGMGAGKIAAQAAHAAVLGVEKAYRMRPAWVEGWRADGMPKVVLQVPGEAELADVCARAEAAGLPVAPVRDRGLTQVAAGTLTCVGIGPAAAPDVDAVTGDLRLL